MTTMNRSAIWFAASGGRIAAIRLCWLACCVVAFSPLAAVGQSPSLSSLTSFGSNGWLAPGANAYLGTAGNERGLAYNPATKNVVLVSRANVSGTSNNVVILDGLTGALIKTMNPSGISGGTFQINMAGAGTDGTIFAANLTGNSATPGAFKVYSWPSEASTAGPTTAFSATISNSVIRVGDAFDVYGSGSAATFVTAGGGATGSNSVFASGLLNGSNTFTRYPSIPNTLTASNDYRLSLAYVDADTIIGNQGTSAKITDFGVSATVTGSIALGAAQRPLDYAVIGGKSVLAVIDTNSALVQVFDVTNPATRTLMAQLNNTTGGLTSNANGTGQLAWGEINGDVATLYAMSTNQGIQAMTFIVPEPTTTLAVGVCTVGLAGMMLRRRKDRDA